MVSLWAHTHTQALTCRLSSLPSGDRATSRKAVEPKGQLPRLLGQPAWVQAQL